MNVFIEELPVFFPFSLLYKEQLEYMIEIKHSLDMNVFLSVIVISAHFIKGSCDY